MKIKLKLTGQHGDYYQDEKGQQVICRKRIALFLTPEAENIVVTIKKTKAVGFKPIAVQECFPNANYWWVKFDGYSGPMTNSADELLTKLLSGFKATTIWVKVEAVQ